MKRTLALIFAALLVMTSIPFTASAETEYEHTLVLDINGYDCHTEGKDIIVYTNDTNAPKDVLANKYYFRYTKLMVFDSTGRLMEAGGDMFENSSTVTGSAQDIVTIPAGGFMVGFNPYNEKELFNAFNIAMEGAMLYNSTMSIIYDMNGSYSKSTNKLTLKYSDPVEPSKDAIRFLFVGNSSTYFNGTPIKFKGLAQAAGIEIDVDYCTFGSAYLSEFANPNHERGIAFRNKLKNNKYDYVVLQDASACTYSSSKPSVQTLLPLIEANGAEALLYMRYSAASTFEQNRTNAIKHHINYTKLSNYFNLLCSPSAHAFIYCHEKYPEIPLYALDGGHHSKEGSYLIALTWLYSYLGVDPVGCTYTADMDADTVAKLQECAKLAVDVGYPFDVDPDELYEKEDVWMDGDVKYKNVAFRKPYTTNGTAYTGKWTEHNEDGTLIGKYTDGTYAGAVGNSTCIGCVKGSEIDITIDLGSLHAVKALRTNLYGNTGWGIPDPTNPASNVSLSVSLSENGKDFIKYENVKAEKKTAEEAWTWNQYTLELENTVTARYARITVTNANFLWCDEIAVYGEALADADPDLKNLALGKNYVISGNGKPHPTYSANLTDGLKAITMTYDSNWFSFYYQPRYPENINAPEGIGNVVIDLEEAYDIYSVKIHTIDLKGDSGINAPHWIKAYLSDDGVNFGDAINILIPASEKGITFDIVGDVRGLARYVKVEFALNGTFAFLNEIEVYGKPHVEEPDPVGMLGDVNSDGKIDEYDYILVARSILGTYTLSDEQKTLSDINKDGVINEYDYILIARHHFGTYVIK